LLNESKADGGEAIPQELQKLVDETSKRVRRQRKNKVEGRGLKMEDSLKPSLPSSTLHPPSSFPDLILIDGGKGQLNAACAELAKLGLESLPVIGLAKEFEEIYRPGESQPLRLGLNHPAVKLLQRVRDESHRVANSYNAQLRIRKISESILDDFPGIGEQRKAALLKKFGSVQRLRTATLEQIAAVPGFGGKAAAELKAFLEARS
jgi:excinuclease ABC subunit C